MGKPLKKSDYFKDPSLPLSVNIRDPQLPFPQHKHGFDELVVILKGTGTHWVNKQSFPVQRGDVFVISVQTEHEYKDMNGLALANILFDSNTLLMNQWDIRMLPGFHALFSLEPQLRKQTKFNNRLHLSKNELDIAQELIHELTYETERQNPGYRVMSKSIFMRLSVFLSRCYSETNTTDSIDLLRLGRSIAHIESNYSEKISLDDLAKKANLSPRHFQRIFRECTGHSPIEHLLNIRIRKAKERLVRTNDTITDIAFDCGFQDSNYFTRQFRKYCGQPPGQYRKLKQYRMLPDMLPA